METKRVDVKLDTYLRRNLPQEEYERISASVLCVISCPEEKRKYRHAVLGHKCIYIVAVPPKSHRIAVHLRDIIGVEMFEDFPDFLHEKHRNKTVHVRIRYNIPVQDKPSVLGSLAGRSPFTLRKRTGSSFTSTSVDDTPTSNSSSPVFSRPDTVTGLGLASAPHSKVSISTSLPPRASHQPVRYSQRSQSLSPNDRQVVNQSPLLTSTSRTVTSRPLPNGTELPPHMGLPYVKTSSTDVDIPLNGLDTISKTDLICQPNMYLRPGNRLTANHRSNSSNSLIAHDPVLIRQRSSSSNDLPRSYLLMAGNNHHHSSLMSIPDTLGPTLPNVISTSNSRVETAMMDVYVLKHTTDFYHQISVAWDNCDINRTLVGSDSEKMSKSPPLQHERFSRLYITLKQELLQSGQDILAGAKLVQELSTAAKRHFLLKKMFWEDCDLFDFCVEQLRLHLGSTTGQSTADRIEYSLILMDVLYQMMRETHLVRKKVVILTRNTGHSVLTLATVIINNIPKLKSGDLEVEPFDNELTEKSCGVMYELLQVCLQARWPESVKISVSIPRVVESLLQLPLIPDFCSRMVKYLTSFLGSSPDQSLSVEAEGQRQVTLYHIVYVLDILTCFSNDAVKMLRTHFGEDFRYFISVTKAKQMLPEGNMLSVKTVRLLQTTKATILTKQL